MNDTSRLCSVVCASPIPLPYAGGSDAFRSFLASRVPPAGMLIRRENHEHLLVIFIFIEFFTEELNDNENPPFVSIVFYILEVERIMSE